jgi:GNAT superfamily N-acetyltransferase
MDIRVETGLAGFTLRFAEEKDVPLILHFIRSLAGYERMSDCVTATEEILHENLFVKKYAEVVIGEYGSEPVGFMLFFHNFSTFLGKPGIYLEDLFVLPEMRGKGIGKVLLSYLASLAVERNCGRVEWSCLDWNKPSIGFYTGLGAIPMDEWTVYRLSGEALQSLAGKFGGPGSGFPEDLGNEII